MGTPVDPPEPGYGADCGKCFDAGATPDSVTVIIAGVTINPIFIFGPVTWTPNGMYHVPQVLACKWQLVLPKFTITFSYGVGGARLVCNETIWGHVFITGSHPGCIPGSYPGVLQVLGFPFYGGGGSVAWGGASKTASLRAWAIAAGIPLDDHLFADCFPSTHPSVHMLYVSHRSQTKIRFKLDTAEMDQYLDLDA